MLLIEKEEAIFIHVPHAAGTSIKNLLRRHFETRKIKGIHDGVSVLSEKYSDYYKFCVVRNHWDWILSKWSYLIKNGGELNPRIYNFITDASNSFSDFVAWYLSYESHKLPQLSGFFDWGGKNMKKVDDFITLDGDEFDGMGKIMKKLGIGDYNLHHANQSHAITREAIFDRSAKELVKRHYQKEIKFFGFEF